MYVKYIFYIMRIYIYTHLLCIMYTGNYKACWKVGKEDKRCKYSFFLFINTPFCLDKALQNK